MVAWPCGREPRALDSAHHDRDDADRARSTESPWLDLAPQKAIAITQAKRDRRKLASSLTLAGIYAGFITWTYVAWYRTEEHEFRWADPTKDGNWKLWSEEGWFGTTRYAGGADKLGHAWATASLARVGTEILNQWGGYDRRLSAIVATSLSEALFLGVEVKDGYAYSFSFGDFAFNTAGAALAWRNRCRHASTSSSICASSTSRARRTASALPTATSTSRRTTRANLPARVSPRRHPPAPRLAVGRLVALRRCLARLRVPRLQADPTCNIKVPPCMDFDKHQDLFVGCRSTRRACSMPCSGAVRGLAQGDHGAFEVFSLPYTTLPVAAHTRVPMGDVPDGQ